MQYIGYVLTIILSSRCSNPGHNNQTWKIKAWSTMYIYRAAQICPNQNIREMRVSPIRVYAYAYTHIRVCIYAHTRIQHIRVCLIGMYELTYCFFFSYRSLLFSMAWQLATERERVLYILTSKRLEPCRLKHTNLPWRKSNNETWSGGAQKLWETILMWKKDYFTTWSKICAKQNWRYHFDKYLRNASHKTFPWRITN